MPGGEAGAGAHSRRQVDGREQTKENKLPPEEGGVSRRGKMEKGGSERNRSILEGLPVITILSFFFPFFFSLKTNWVSFCYIHYKMIILSAPG